MRRRTHRHRSRTCKRLVEAMDGSIEIKDSAPRQQVILQTLLQKPVAPAILREVVLSAGSRLYK
jgi:hypothetical protein